MFCALQKLEAPVRSEGSPLNGEGIYFMPCVSVEVPLFFSFYVMLGGVFCAVLLGCALLLDVDKYT